MGSEEHPAHDPLGKMLSWPFLRKKNTKTKANLGRL